MRKSTKITFATQWLAAILITAITSLSFANPVIPVPTQPERPVFTPAAPKLDAKGYILIDATSGKILAEKNAQKKAPPASLTKLMTMYIVSAAIQGGQLNLDDKIKVSKKAWKTGGSRMFLKAGQEVRVRDLIQGVVVDSGNDATITLAEYLGGNEESFTLMMNQQAKRLGMTNSHFTDSTGLPHPEHHSTPYDLALLTQAYIKHFPEEYHYYSQKWFKFNGIKQPNRNRLLWRYKDADGVKTGHTNEAGYCLISSAKKDGMRLISVVMGAPSDRGRTNDSIRLLTYGFRFFRTHKLYQANTTLTKAQVWQGKTSEVPLGLAEDLYVTVPKGQYKKLKASIELDHALKAPVTKNQAYGKLKVMLGDELITEKPLVALENDPVGGIWRRAADAVKLRFHKMFSKKKTKTEVS